MRSRTFIVLALAFLGPLLTSCSHGQASSAGCGFAARVSVANSTKKMSVGSCFYFGPEAPVVQIEAGQVLTVHYYEHGIASARSQNSNVLELVAENSTEQRFDAVAPGISEILYSPPTEGLLLCQSSSAEKNMAAPCIVAKVMVKASCVNKSPGTCGSSHDKGTTVSKVSKPQIPPSIVALKAQQSPLAVMCEPGFFSQAQLHQMVQTFGFIECFRFSGKDTWVVFGDGLPQQTNAASLSSTWGGIVLGLEKCAGSDATCLNPALVHNFADFTVYHPPRPRINGFDGLLTTAYGNLISITDGTSCSPVTFDMSNAKWYPKTSNKKLLETNPGTVKSLPTPVPVSGSKALTEEAPPPTVSAC